MVIFEWQLYVATCSPARDVGAGYVAWGHSTLVGPVSKRPILSSLVYCQKVIWADLIHKKT